MWIATILTVAVTVLTLSKMQSVKKNPQTNHLTLWAHCTFQWLVGKSRFLFLFYIFCQSKERNASQHTGHAHYMTLLLNSNNWLCYRSPKPVGSEVALCVLRALCRQMVSISVGADSLHAGYHSEAEPAAKTHLVVTQRVWNTQLEFFSSSGPCGLLHRCMVL